MVLHARDTVVQKSDWILAFMAIAVQWLYLSFLIACLILDDHLKAIWNIDISEIIKEGEWNIHIFLSFFYTLTSGLVHSIGSVNVSWMKGRSNSHSHQRRLVIHSYRRYCMLTLRVRIRLAALTRLFILLLLILFVRNILTK